MSTVRLLHQHVLMGPERATAPAKGVCHSLNQHACTIRSEYGSDSLDPTDPHTQLLRELPLYSVLGYSKQQ